MSKPSKNKGKAGKRHSAEEPEGKEPKAKSKDKTPPPAPTPEPEAPKVKGKLLAVEGVRGKELEKGAEKLAKMCGGVPCSRFDASNTFFELRLGKVKRYNPPPRALLLLYAYDLLFRLRWEIQPALAEGYTLVAAPYVETAVGFGLASGLPKEWLEELFSFAPKPDACFRVKEDDKFKPKKKDGDLDSGLKSASGFVEFCTSLLAANSPDWGAMELRAAVLKHLDELEQGGVVDKLGKKLPKGWGK